MDRSLSGGNVQTEVRKGPWTLEEDLSLMSYITVNGEGAWNNLARAAGLNRTGKSCRLRWLNYLRPGVRRGNFTPEEQMLIVELQSRWGNRWSKIAKHLPGRTDNEIKNFWRTMIQKKRKQCCGENENTAVGYSNAAVLATDDQAGGNTSQASSTQGSHGIVAQTSLLCLDHQNNAVHGGGGGLSIPDIPPELLAEPSDNFSWALADFWSPIQSLNCNF